MDPIRRIFRKSDDLSAVLDRADRQAEAHFRGPAHRQLRDDGHFVRVSWSQRLQKKLEVDSAMIAIDRAVLKAKTDRTMGKGSALAQRIAQMKRRHADELDKIASEVDAFEKVAPDAYAAGHAVVQEQRDDLDEMLSDLRQLSNLAPPD